MASKEDHAMRGGVKGAHTDTQRDTHPSKQSRV